MSDVRCTQVEIRMSYDNCGNSFIVHLLNMTKLLIILLLVSTLTSAQNVKTTESSGPSNIYNDALKRFLILTSLNKNPIYDSLFIQQDNIITDSLMTSINGCKLIVVDSSFLQEKLRQDSAFMLLKLFPLSFDKSVFYVSLIPFKVTETNGEAYLTNTGTFKVEYLFDSRIKAFRFRKGKSYSY